MAIPRQSAQSESAENMITTSKGGKSASPKNPAGDNTGTSVNSSKSVTVAPVNAPEAPDAAGPSSPAATSSAVVSTTAPLTVAAPLPAVVLPATAAQSTAPVPDSDLPSILRRLTPIQRAKLRAAAIGEGVISRSGAGIGQENSDGSLSVVIRVDGDLVPQLRTWAEEAGKPVDEQIREIVGMLLSSYLLSPWEAPQPVSSPNPPA